MPDIKGVAVVEAGGRKWDVPVKKASQSVTIIVNVVILVAASVMEVVTLINQESWDEPNTALLVGLVVPVFNIWQRFQTKLPIVVSGGE